MAALVGRPVLITAAVEERVEAAVERLEPPGDAVTKR